MDDNTKIAILGLGYVGLPLAVHFSVKNSKIGVLGLTFKEDSPDLRNIRMLDIIEKLYSYGTNVLVHDAISDSKEAMAYYDINLCKWEDLKDLSALVLEVPIMRIWKKIFQNIRR